MNANNTKTSRFIVEQTSAAFADASKAPDEAWKTVSSHRLEGRAIDAARKLDRTMTARCGSHSWDSHRRVWDTVEDVQVFYAMG